MIAVDAEISVVTPYDNCVLVVLLIRQLRCGVTTGRVEKITSTQ